ncbi:uncharacterized protein LOC134196634 [Corticium candelabrum]|uniref:uncharacterized protein LOC134196634 n=1 Tax=Corticium candelabrum TaxID=121492 RepID=UPI002E2760ED|nr:uncharacterized protein LOC134196634 [Corticium candelabrum]
MSICNFFQRITPKDKSVFVPIPFNAEEEAANDAVGDEDNDLLALRAKRRKTTSQHTYSEEVRAAIGKYTAHHGPAAAVRDFTRQLRWNVPESTVRKFRDLYKVELQRHECTWLPIAQFKTAQ